MRPSMLILLLATTAPALAAGPTTALRAEFVPDRAAPEIALACAPMATVMDRLAQSPWLMGLQGSARAPDALAGALEVLVDPARSREAGIDPDGVIGIAMAEHDMRFSVPFSGTADQAAELLRIGDDDAWRPGDGGWHKDRDAKRLDIVVGDGHLMMRSRTRGHPPAGPADPPPLLTGLPNGPGCAGWVDLQSFAPLQGRPVNVAAWFPLGSGEPAVLRLRMPNHPGPDLVGPVTPPLPITSTRRPDAVVSLGVNLDQLIVPDQVAGMLKVSPGAVSDLGAAGGRGPKVGAGAVIGVYARPGQPQFVAVVPVTSHGGRPFSARRIAQGISKMGGNDAARVERAGPHTFTLTTQEGQEITLFARRGQVIASNNIDLLTAVVTGSGEPWLTDAQQAWATQWPLALSARGPIPQLGMDLELMAGLQIEGEILQLTLRMTPGLFDPAVLQAIQGLTHRRRR